MNPNVGMTNMNPMGGPVGGAPVPMMNNGPVNPQQAAAAAAANANRQQPGNDNQRTHLNTYIYEYFIRYGMFDCARALLSSDQPVNVQKDGAGNKGNAVNGSNDDAMDTDSKDDIDSKLPEDLPPPKLPMPASESSFLYEWFCVFWDIYNAQRLKGPNNTVNQYVAHTQQQDLLRQMRPEMAQQHYQAQIMRNVQTMNGAMAGMNMKQNNLARAAMANNQNHPQMQMLQQAKQNQMQRDPSNMNVNQGERPSSPASGENAPSPSKRQRVDAPFNPNQPGAVMGNGRGQVMGGQQMPQSVAAAHQMLAMNGINPNSLNAQQLQNFVSSGPAAQQKSIATYSQNLQQQQGAQMGNKQMPNVPGPQNQGSPMQQQGPDGNMLNSYYNAGDMAGAAGMRPGAPGQQPPGSNHALQDYQMQLMLLEQQNKKRLMMARQEQDSMGGVSREGGPGPSPGGPGQPVPTGPNGQPFPDTSPQAMRTGTSPNPSEQMKRGTPQMNNNSGIPSPVPEGGQSRGSPNSMNFMGNHVDPKMAPHFFNGVDGNNMAAAQAQMNGMRPPGAHPGQPFNGQMNPQQMMAARQGQQPGPNGQQWQQGPNGQMQPQGMQQGQQPGQAQGTPQQRSMPPPSAPAQVAAANANRTTASPQQAAAAPPTPNQGNKAAPKKKETKAAKEKRAANKKSNQNLNNASATPAAENSGEGEGAAPATPITPVNPGFNKGQQGASGAQATGTAAPAVPAPTPVAPPAGNDPSQNGMMDGFGNMVGLDGMNFADPMASSDVLNDFDFDSFLHDGDTDNPPFDFNNAVFDTNEIPAE